MKTKLLAMALMAGSTMFGGVRFGIGVGFGPTHVVVGTAYRPPCPGPGYVWIDGYNGAVGYWAAPPYAGAYWVGPSYVGGRFVAGYWGGERFVGHDYGRPVFHNNFRPEVHNARNFRR